MKGWREWRAVWTHGSAKRIDKTIPLNKVIIYDEVGKLVLEIYGGTGTNGGTVSSHRISPQPREK